MEIRPIQQKDAAAFREAVDAVARERRYLAFLAIEGATVLGWCDAIPGQAARGTAHVATLGVGVIQSRRGQGIGRKLIDAVMGKARAQGIEIIALSVQASNARAIALYRKLGFVEEGRKVRGRLVDGVYEDVILMALDLRKSADPVGRVTP
jgi:ribosomal protein S18 acetylase RimI-like enzyme